MSQPRNILRRNFADALRRNYATRACLAPDNKRQFWSSRAAAMQCAGNLPPKVGAVVLNLMAKHSTEKHFENLCNELNQSK